MFKQSDLISEERIAALRKNRWNKRELSFSKLMPVMGKAAVDEIRKIYDLFDERMLIWYAGLYDPDIGGFYYSNSARDTEGFLPDIESTAQAVNFITEMSGICKGEAEGDYPITKLPSHLAEKISSFAYNLQDQDGYFYHPQWGKDISAPRRGRDCGWAWRMITPLGKNTKYLRVTERQGRDDVESTLPEYLQSIDEFNEWIRHHDLKTKSYPFGNLINSIASQIKAAGPEYVEALVSYLNDNQYPENGLWQPEINYDSINGLMKFGITYPTFNATLPYPEQSFESARTAIMSDEEVTFACQFYNAWAALRCAMTSVKESGNKERYKVLRTELRREAASMIRKTGEKMLKTRCDDGNFAYFSADSGKYCDKAQGSPVSPYGIREADINGNGCSTRGPLRYMFAAFGVDMPPIFTPEDAEFVFELMSARKSVVKTAQYTNE